VSFFNFLKKPNNPALPLPTPDYSRTYHDNHNNVLRLFFNQLTNVFDNILGPNGGQFIDCPNGLFFNTQDQNYAANGTAYPVEFDSTYLSNGVALRSGSSSQVGVTVSGVYNFQYTGQVLASSGNKKDVALWIARGGSDITYSTRINSIQANGHYFEIVWNFNIDLAAGEYIELKTSVSNNFADIKLAAIAASSPYVAGASSVLAVNYAAPLPDPRPVLP
jgi:hypothetical protein